MSFVIIECTLMGVSNTVILEVFEGYDENSRASRSNTTYSQHNKYTLFSGNSRNIFVNSV